MKIATLFTLTILFASLNSFSADPKLQADNEAINSACTADSATAGCGTEKVGTGLLKCLHSYKKAHHEFKFSEACKSAMKKRHEDKMSK